MEGYVIIKISNRFIRMTMLFCVLFLLWMLISPVWANQTVKIGVLAKRGDATALAQWADMAQYLSSEIENYTFTIVPLGFEELFDAVRDGSIDFVITNTMFYVDLEYRYGVSRIATLKNLGKNGEALTQFGGVIFTRKDNDINTLQDLKGKRFGAVNINSFGGWVMGEKELLDHELIMDDFGKFEFFGSHDNVVKAVQSRQIDAGTVRTDTLERMASEKRINMSDFKILSQKHYNDFPYVTSTDLYPEWPFAKISETSDVLANKVTIALLKMPRQSPAAISAKIAGWTAPLDYSKVHHLLQALQLGPYAQQVKKITIAQEDLAFHELMDRKELFFFSVAFLLLAVYLMFQMLRRSSLLDIKLSLFNIFLVVFELGAIFFLIYEVVVLDRVEHALAEANENQYEMVKVADRLRQSSDDLTHFARAYVITGDEKFKARYYTTLDIRNGKAPRPENYEGLYWDLNKITRMKRHPDGKPVALLTLFESLPYAQEELELLKRSQANSNELVNLEIEAFKAMEKGNQQRAIQLVHSPDYYNAKHKIMLPIDEMMTMLRTRTTAEIDRMHQEITMQVHLLLIAGILFVIGNLIVYTLLHKKVNQPVRYLTGVIKKFEMGENVVEKRTFYKDEVGYMIDQFFDMHRVIEDARKEVEHLFQRTQSSINYAALIQDAMMPRQNDFSKYVDDHFVIWEPRDVVGGDIFFLETLHDEDEMLLMVIDCTGHGVPGAFVTLLVKAIERNMVTRIHRTDEVVSPAKLLSIFNVSLKYLLQQDQSDTIANVGFDGIILYYNRKKNLIRFAGANTPLFMVKENRLEMIAGDRQSIGYKSSNTEYAFTDHEIVVDAPVSVYLVTDGYLDQNGGSKSFPFGKRRFVELIEANNASPMREQKSVFLQELADYQGSEARNDDLTLVAFNVHPNDESA